MLNKNSKIFVAGHKGLVGSAIIRKLIQKGYNNIITIEKKTRFNKSAKKYIIF